MEYFLGSTKENYPCGGRQTLGLFYIRQEIVRSDGAACLANDILHLSRTRRSGAFEPIAYRLLRRAKALSKN